MIDPQNSLTVLYKVGPKWAKAKGARVLLEESLRIVKAEQMAQHEGSMASREALAVASPEYRQAVKDYALAVEAEAELHRMLVTAEAAIEIWRSQEASNRRMDKAAA